MNFWIKVCAFFFGGGLLSMLLVTADHLLGLGIWNGAYPPTHTDAQGHQVASTYGGCMLALAATAVIAGALGGWLWRRREIRALTALAILEEADEDE